ncbi:MAG TPA: hypothetical protein VFS25_13870 [Chitinophaga sp.]|uniref:hypothetical protein n=1 Tax=Chitinophaga sp. TaxID=1869181 RepID=UPI002DBAB5A0|nr:hypothetical protein [Chitinophaga sp.]HEU4553924.1 hypothetical protein [Chitinophaga sp.]
MSNCHCHTTINRDGSGQLGRYLKALDPGYAPVDDRSFEDLLVFAKRYAAQIRFYDIPASQVEDDTPAAQVSWREFFRHDMAVIAASIGTIDLAQIKKDYDENRARLDLQPNGNTYANLFDPILGMLARLDRWYSLAIPQNPLYADLTLAIQSTLQEQVKKMIAYEEGFKLVDAKNSFTLDFSPIENDDVWKINDAVDADISIYEGSTPEDKIRYAALFVDAIFLSFYGVISQLVERSESYLQYAMEQYPAHQPHMALFIAFLQLFRLAQEQMNTLTGRMLDFYYREVLQLTEKPALPDRAFVIFELAKDVASYDLEPGTALDAGKDAAGKDQVYKTADPLVVNQAKVKELKTLFIEKLPLEAAEDDKTIHAMYARPVANSQDGYGTAFTDPYPKWPTFGKGSNHPGSPKNICEALDIINDELNTRNETAIGFAIASPQLVMQGGNRLVTLRSAGIAELFAGGGVEIWFTAEEGWLKIDTPITTAQFTKLYANEFFTNDENLGACYYLDTAVPNTIQVFLPIAEKGIIPFDAKLHPGRTYNTAFPVMQVMVGPEINLSAARYRNLSYADLSIAVRVGSFNDYPIIGIAAAAFQKDSFANFDGLKVLTLQNDDGLLTPGKPFDPFTAYPKTGSTFYIGSNEVFNKPLKELSVNIRHVNSSDALTDINERTVDYKVSVLQNRQWQYLTTKQWGRSTFNEQELTYDILYTGGNGDNVPSTEIDLPRPPLAYPTEWENGRTVKGFIQIENQFFIDPNSQTFFQDAVSYASYFKIKEVSLSYYSELAALEAGTDQVFHVYPFGAAEIDLATGINQVRSFAHLENVVVPIRNLPSRLGRKTADLLVDAKGALLPQFTWESPYSQYTQDTEDNGTVDTSAGLATSTTLDASGQPAAVAKDKATAKAQARDASDRYLAKLLLNASGIDTGAQLNQYSGTIQEAGMLFIGLEKVQPLQTLSLLFQFAEGTAQDEENDPPPVHWSYLSNNEWRPLNGEAIVFDGTYDFQTTGIIKIDVPEDATNNNTIITGGLHWFCASVTGHADRFPMLVDVVAQAVEAVFDNNGNDPSHFDNALPAGSISGLSVKVAEVSKVQQPFASFDGKHAEVGQTFYTRVSERLRHKGRAINAWDYEHLVLNRFPGIYKVKCIPYTDPNCLCREHATAPNANGQQQTTCCGPQIAPGHVLLVAIANLKNRNAINPLQPKTSRRTLLEIEDYLKKRSTPFVQIRARNPLYEQVLTFFRVKFVSGTDKGYYLKKLNEELVHFLTPWAFDENADVQFGQKIYASSIVNFIEERPYVDFITDFLLFVCKDECCPPTADNPNGNDDNSDDNDMPDVLDRLTGCNDVEQLLQDQLNFIGVVVAQPSTPRSILVSVPRHIIVPYEEPVKPSRCEQRAAAQVLVPGPVAGVPRIPQATEPAPERPQATGTPAVPTTGTNAAVEKTTPATGQPTADKTAAEKATGSTGTAAPANKTATDKGTAATDKTTAATPAADKTAAESTTTSAADKGAADTAGKPAGQPAPEKTPAAPLKLTGAKKATKKTDKKNPK